jgi:hypothetical protein
MTPSKTHTAHLSASARFGIVGLGIALVAIAIASLSAPVLAQDEPASHASAAAAGMAGDTPDPASKAPAPDTTNAHGNGAATERPSSEGNETKADPETSRGRDRDSGKDAKTENKTGNKTDSKADNAPIDARNTIIKPFGYARTSRLHAWKKSAPSHPLGASCKPCRNWNAARHMAVRNAIGQPTVRTDRKDKKDTAGTPNSVASPNTIEAGNDAHTSLTPAGVHGPAVAQPVTSATQRNVFVPAMANASLINGHDMARRLSGSRSVGGPPTAMAGVISGSSFHHKLP